MSAYTEFMLALDVQDPHERLETAERWWREWVAVAVSRLSVDESLPTQSVQLLRDANERARRRLGNLIAESTHVLREELTPESASVRRYLYSVGVLRAEPVRDETYHRNRRMIGSARTPPGGVAPPRTSDNFSDINTVPSSEPSAMCRMPVSGFTAWRWRDVAIEILGGDHGAGQQRSAGEGSDDGSREGNEAGALRPDSDITASRTR